MGNIRAPSASTASLASANTQKGHAKATRPRKHHAVTRHSRPHKLDKAKAAVKDAAKRAQKAKRLANHHPCIAYIGNVAPGIDEDTLRAYFSNCGKILSARIHCSGGVAMTVKPPPANYHENKKVSQIAVVVFESQVARNRAFTMDGLLGGRQPTVSLSISDMPEVQEKIAMRLEDYRSRLEPEDRSRAQRSALRSLKVEPTDLVDPRYERKRKFMFQATVM